MGQHDPEYSDVEEHIKQITATIRDARALIVATEVRIAQAREALAKLHQIKAAYDALRAGRLTIPTDDSRPS